MLARAAREVVVAAQLVEHGAADALRREGLELHALGRVEARERVGQADHADLDQVVDLDVGRQLGDHLMGQAPDQPAVLLQRRVQVQLAFGGVHGSSGNHESATVDRRVAAVRAAEAAPARRASAQPLGDEAAQVGAGRLRVASPAGSMRAQSRSTPPKKLSVQEASLRGDAFGARRLRRRAEQQVEHDQAGALRQQLHRRIGVGDAVGGGLRRGRSGTAPRRHAAPLRLVREQAAQLGRAGVHEHDVAVRRRLGDALQEARGSSRADVDEAQRQAARGEVGDLRPTSRSMHAPRSTSAISPALAGALGGIDDEARRAALGERGAEPLEQHAAEGDVRVARRRE